MADEEEVADEEVTAKVAKDLDNLQAEFDAEEVPAPTAESEKAEAQGDGDPGDGDEVVPPVFDGPHFKKIEPMTLTRESLDAASYREAKRDALNRARGR